MRGALGCRHQPMHVSQFAMQRDLILGFDRGVHFLRERIDLFA